MADRIEHRGYIAYQSVYNNRVVIGKDGRVETSIATDKCLDADGLRRVIDDFIEAKGGDNK